MEDKIGDLERRISDIESRLMKLETGTKPPETVIPSKDFPSKSEEPSFPFKLAANWFAIVGIVAIVFAVVFFLKFAFDNGLIGPVGQVVIGLVFGISLIFAGEFLREKVHKYSQIISSGGIVDFFS